jgi:hypothetical protein
MTQLLEVAFHGNTLLVTEHEQQPFVPMKPVIEGMGMDWKSQHTKISANKDRWGMVIITIPSKGGEQRASCLPLRKLPGWLMSIHSNKVKPEIRDKVIAFQNECDDVLWERWQKWNNQETQLTNNSCQLITVNQQGVLFNLMANRFPDGRDRPYAWGRFNNHFRINSYKNLPFTKYEEACRYIPSIPGKKEVRTLPAPIPAIKPPVWTKPDPAGSADAIRSIQTMKSIITELQTWCHELPIEAGMPLWEALDDLKRLLITGSTEVSEALTHLEFSVRFLKRWMGRSQ